MDGVGIGAGASGRNGGFLGLLEEAVAWCGALEEERPVAFDQAARRAGAELLA